MITAITTLRSLLGKQPSPDELQTVLSSISQGISYSPDVKVYPDGVYYNYYGLGMSLLAVPEKGYRLGSGSDLDISRLRIQSIDLFNKSINGNKKSKYAAFACIPFVLDYPPDRPLSVTTTTAGHEYVQHLGEPERKGGGEGLSTSIGIWCEWSRYGIMVEFGGSEAHGPQAWERGKNAQWAFMTLFEPSKEQYR